MAKKDKQSKLFNWISMNEATGVRPQDEKKSDQRCETIFGRFKMQLLRKHDKDRSIGLGAARCRLTSGSLAYRQRLRFSLPLFRCFGRHASRNIRLLVCACESGYLLHSISKVRRACRNTLTRLFGVIAFVEFEPLLSKAPTNSRRQRRSDSGECVRRTK